MTLINEAAAVYLGSTAVERVYLGAQLVWQPEVTGPAAVGGIEAVIEQGGLYYRVHTFTTSGALTVHRDVDVDYLLVPGGGGGGANQFEGGGGGAAGTPASGRISIGVGAFGVSVGLGGRADLPVGGNDPVNGALPGGSTSAFGITAQGGAPGAWYRGMAGVAGPNGSGAAGFSSGSATYGGAGSSGFNGGAGAAFNGGAGAGAGGHGANAPFSTSAPAALGGAGILSDISGTLTEYGRGGNGGNYGTFGSPSRPNSGDGGAGGGRWFASSANVGAAGAAGIAIVRYEISEAEYFAGV